MEIKTHYENWINTSPEHLSDGKTYGEIWDHICKWTPPKPTPSIQYDMSDITLPTLPQPMTAEGYTEICIRHHENITSGRNAFNPFADEWVYNVQYESAPPAEKKKKKTKKQQRAEDALPSDNYQKYDPSAKLSNKPAPTIVYPDGYNIVFIAGSMILHCQYGNEKTTLCKKKIERVALDAEKLDTLYSVCPRCKSLVVTK